MGQLVSLNKSDTASPAQISDGEPDVIDCNAGLSFPDLAERVCEGMNALEIVELVKGKLNRSQVELLTDSQYYRNRHSETQHQEIQHRRNPTLQWL